MFNLKPIKYHYFIRILNKSNCKLNSNWAKNVFINGKII